MRVALVRLHNVFWLPILLAIRILAQSVLQRVVVLPLRLLFFSQGSEVPELLYVFSRSFREQLRCGLLSGDGFAFWLS